MKKLLISTSLLLISIFINSCYDQRKWHEPELISEMNFTKFLLPVFPKAVIDNNLNAKVVWIQGANFQSLQQMENHYNINSGWDVPQVLGRQMVYYISDFSSNTNGDAVYTYTIRSPSGIAMRFYNKETGWAINHEQISNGSQSGVNNKVVIDDEGNMIFTWDQYTNNSHIILARIFHKQAGWSDIFEIENFFSGIYTTSGPSLAMNPKGDAIILWRRLDLNNGNSICYRLYHKNSGWSEIQVMPNDNNGIASDYNYPVKMDSAGNCTLLYRNNDKSLFVRNLSSIGKWNEPKLLSTSAYFSKYSIAINKVGAALIVWAEKQDDGRTILKSITSFQSIWDKPVIIDTLENNANNISCHYNDLGQGVVLWFEYSENREYSIISRQYSAQENSWINKSIVYSGIFPTDNSSLGFNLSTNSNGDIIAVWGVTDHESKTANIWSSIYH